MPYRLAIPHHDFYLNGPPQVCLHESTLLSGPFRTLAAVTAVPSVLGMLSGDKGEFQEDLFISNFALVAEGGFEPPTFRL